MKSVVCFVAMICITFSVFADSGDTSKFSANKQQEENGGITLPTGFKAVVVADNLGNARHLAVNSNGDVYVKLERLKDGNGIVRLWDANGDGVAEDISSFGKYIGTGILI